MSIYFYLARASKYEIGSAPGDNTKMSGVVDVESLKEPLRSNTGDSMNPLPKIWRTKFLILRISF